MEGELKANLRALADAYLAVSPGKETGLWLRAANDARFMSRVEGGKSFTVKTYDRAVAWFADNWPDRAEWPEFVARPINSNEAAA